MITATLNSVTQLNDTTFSFWFKPSVSLDYTAGQFIEIFLPHDADNRGTHRWFTLSSSPSEELLAITTRKVDRQSSFKKGLFSLQPGDSVQLSQAMGDFVLPMQKSIPIIYLVRGIGSTPVRSMLQYLQDKGEDRSVRVIYSVKKTSDALFTDLLTSVAEDVTIREIKDITDVTIPVSDTVEQIKLAPQSRIYVSGPEQFVEIAYEELQKSGVKQSSVVTDYFHGYDA